MKRVFGQQIACIAAFVAASSLCAFAQDSAEWQTPAFKQMKPARYEAAHRERRLIYNNDGGDAVVQAESPTRQALLDCRTTGIEGTQVDAIFYCTSRGTFGSFTHKSEAGTTFVSKEGRYSKNMTGDLIAQGTDPLQVMIDFCREHEIEIFWSMRMNDTHDSWGYEWEDLVTSQLKKDHPEWLVAGKENRPKVGGFKAADFTHPEIREFSFRYVEEVCRNYDVDGVEMDFLRHPVFFKRHAWGEDCTQEECDMMTEMVRQVRLAADARGVERGKPILVSVRVPDSAGYCKAIGLDIKRWLREGLIDMMAVSCYYRLSPWETSVALGHAHGVPVYGCLSETRFKDEPARTPRASAACYRGRAMNVWAAGADGVYLFNLFNPKSELWGQLGSPDTIRQHERLYVNVTRPLKTASQWLVGADRFITRDTLSPQYPRELIPAVPVEAVLTVGEHPRGEEAEMKAEVWFEGLPVPKDVAVAVNGHALADPVQKDHLVVYTVPPEALVQGDNRFVFTLSAVCSAQPLLKDVMLRITPR